VGRKGLGLVGHEEEVLLILLVVLGLLGELGVALVARVLLDLLHRSKKTFATNKTPRLSYENERMEACN
jgi:hypothetical protein